MLNFYSRKKWLQVGLGLLFVEFVLSDCPFPRMRLDNGRILRQSKADANATIAKEMYLLRFRCFSGYTLIGPVAIICLSDQWSDVIPTCTKMQCSDPPVIENAVHQVHSVVNKLPTSVSVVVYTCKAGYEMENDSVSTLTCNLDNSGNTAVWKGDMPHCIKKVSCPDPGVSDDGVREGDCCFTGDVLRFSCNEGFELVGVNELQCLSTGSWSSEHPLCRQIFCNFPEPLVNGTILELESTNKTKFPYNSELTYVCEKGHRLEEGDSWRFCDSYGWSGVTPYCKVIYCSDPGAPENGAKEGNGYEIGAKVRFKCSNGYFLVGSFERRCMPNGQWTGEIARCDTDTNYCPNPGIPINGFKNSTKYDMGAVVGFGCRKRYSHFGSEARKCMPDRTWSGTETRCIGPYDFDNSAQVRDHFKIVMKEQEYELQKLREAKRNLSPNPMGGIIDINHPGRLILYFLFDVSESVGQENFDKSIKFAKAMVKRVGISETGARAGAVTFSSKETGTEFHPLDLRTTEEVVDALDEISFTGGVKYYLSPLYIVSSESIPLTQAVLGKKGQKSIVFILTDGRTNMGGNVQEEATALKNGGVEIYCIGITDNVQKDSLYKIASDESHVFILENYSTLSYLIQEITNGTIDYSECGRVEVNGGKHIAAGGSQTVKIWPWMVAIYFLPRGTVDPKEAKIWCGGTIIHKFFILTSAKCMFIREVYLFNRRDAKEVIVKFSLTHTKNENFIQEPEVKNIFVHPKFIKGSSFDYDIAILQLSKPIEYNAYVRPICLPPTELSEGSNLYKTKESVLALGWAQPRAVSMTMFVDSKERGDLKELIQPIQSREVCSQSIAQCNLSTQLFSDHMFCSGEGKGEPDTGIGDGGCPSMQSQLNEEGNLYWTQVGIVSWAFGCGFPNTYVFDIHVSRLMPWIDQKIKNALEEDM